jgi:hypothetical protein
MEQSPEVNAFILCRSAVQNGGAGEWSLQDIVWMLRTYDFENGSIDLTVYFHISGIPKPTELSVQIIEVKSGTPVWTLPEPIQIPRQTHSCDEGKIILRDVRFNEPDPDVGWTEYDVILLLDGKKSSASHGLSIH